MSNKFVRVVAIVLAVLMAGGVFAAVLQVFAVSPEAAAVAATGQRSYWPVIVALIAAVVLIVLCIRVADGLHPIFQTDTADIRSPRLPFFHKAQSAGPHC